MTLKSLENPGVEDLHVALQQQPSIAWQYLGLPVAPLVALVNKALLVMDADLTRVSPSLSPTHCWLRGLGHEGNHGKVDFSVGDPGSLGKRIRLGIVMERRGAGIFG